MASASKAVCPVEGCEFKSHNLLAHMGKAHNIGWKDAIDQFGAGPLLSESGMKRAAALGKAALAADEGSSAADTEAFMEVAPERPRKRFEIGKTFGVDLGFEYEYGADGRPLTDASGNKKVLKKGGKPVKRKMYANGFETPGPYTPETDPLHVFQVDTLIEALMCWEDGMFPYTSGPSGSGKTSLWRQIAARLNINFFCQPCYRRLTEEVSLGYWLVRGTEMQWVPGIVYQSYHYPGSILCVDEYDAQSEDHAMIFQRPLERSDRHLVVPNGEELSPPADHLIVATANTTGMGDQGGLYQSGTTVLNFANISRFEWYLEVDFPGPDDEAKILMSRFGEDLSQEEADAIVQAAGAIREAFVNGELSQPVTPRDTQAWAKSYGLLLDLKRSAEGAFVRRFSPDERDTVRGLVQRAVDRYESSTF